MDGEVTQLHNAIHMLEEQRAILGDAVVEAALAPLREKLAALTGQTQREEQRKQATVLFADVSGFTELGEMLDAEELAALMNELWALLDQTIREHGGRIDKHIGDAVMALWGTEIAREDDPEQAVRAALAMQTAAASFSSARSRTIEGVRSRLGMRIGINTGPVLIGRVGTTGEITAMGDTVNVASRLEQASPVGAVLIAHDTYRHIRGVFDVIPQEAMHVKGRSQPVRSYIVQRAKPRAFRMTTRGVEGIETRMIGREVELLALQNAFADVVESSELRVITVIGEAGVGKSRLLYEFENWIELQPQRVHYLKGRSTPVQQNRPLSLFRDVFAFRFDILDSDEASTAMAKFRTGMRGILEAEEADLVGHWLGFDFSESQAVARLAGTGNLGKLAQGYLLRYMRWRVEQQPVALLLEDMHWTDDASLDLVTSLVDYLKSAGRDGRLLVAGLARPSFLERRPFWGEGQVGWSRMQLMPLPKRAGRILVGEILQRVDHVPEKLRDLILDSAEGNPYYVEETIKMLIDEGIIVRGDTQWRVVEDRLGEIQIPTTLTGLLQARLDALPHTERRVLQQASVVGRLFWDSAVAQLSETQRDVIAPDLDAIRNRELIYRRERSAFAGCQEYVFKHALLRDVAYETVLLRLRRAYHADVARWLEENAGSRLSEYLALIAEHYTLAGETERAIDFWKRAGDQSYLGGTASGALDAYQRAFTLMQDLERRAIDNELSFKMGKTYVRLGQIDNAMRLMRQVNQQARILEDNKLRAQALNYLAICAIHSADHGEFDRLVAEARPLAHGEGGVTLAKHLVNSAYSHWRAEDLETARSELEQGLALAREAQDRLAELECLNMLGNLLAVSQTDLNLPETIYEEARQLAIDLGDRSWEITILSNLGNIYFGRGQFEKAKEMYLYAVEAHREIANVRAETAALTNLAFAELELGELETATAHTLKSLVQAQALGMRAIVAYAVLLWGKLEAARGNVERALALYGVVKQDPATFKDAHRDLDIAIQALQLPAAEIRAGLAAGAGLDLDEVAVQILDESS